MGPFLFPFVLFHDWSKEEKIGGEETPTKAYVDVQRNEKTPSASFSRQMCSLRQIYSFTLCL